MRERRLIRDERGVASVEMALVLPIFLLLLLGIATLGHALTIQFLVSSAAYDAARTCALTQQCNTARATIVANQRLSTGFSAGGCGALEVTAALQLASSVPGVNRCQVKINCPYLGVAGGKKFGMLEDQGLVITVIQGFAVMPY